MNINKIDRRLLNEISILNSEKKTFCFVFGRDFCKTKALLEQKKVHIENVYLFINCFLCKASQKEIFSLSNVEAVDYIYSLSVANALMYVSKKIISADKVAGYGDGVGVAFIDTGVAPHADFLIGKNRVAFFKDFVAGKKNMYDDNGHGTFVCGVCSGCGVMSKFRYSGVAPKSTIFALKALDGKGEASANKILDAQSGLIQLQ